MDVKNARPLSETEAAERLKNGMGASPAGSATKSVGAIFAGRICTLFNLVNALLAVLLAFVGSFKNMAFLGIVFFNTGIGIFQELKAKRITDKLIKASTPIVRVERSDGEKLIPWTKAVKGDIVTLTEGNSVCADCTVIEGSVDCDDSALTGESEPVTVAEGGVVLSGCVVLSGKVKCVITAAGSETKAFAISESSRRVKLKNSVIINNMNRIIKLISLLLIPFGAAFFCKMFFISHTDLQTAVTSLAAAMVGMIPSGLILLTSTALAVSVVKLSSKKVLVNEMGSIEMLARTNVVCLDKTGTITTGELKVEKIIYFAPSDETNAALASVTSGGGNATARTISEYVNTAPLKVVSSVPFASSRKWSAVCTESKSYLLGAPEMLLSEKQRESAGIPELNKRFRVVCVCEADGIVTKDYVPNVLRLMGIAVLCECIRDGAAEAIAKLQATGVTVKVISGDNPVTVSASAVRCGITNAESLVDLSSLPPDVSYTDIATEYTVFGRSTPEQKKKLVSALKSLGNTVSMTGDGINDMPAMKEADCSLALADGTDGSRSAGDIVMSGNGFYDLADIIDEGRTVINNIGNYASLFLTKTVFSLIVTLLFLFLPWKYSLQPIQLTLIGTFTIGAPAFLLSLFPDKRKPNERFYDKIVQTAVPAGIVCAAATVLLTGFGIGGDTYSYVIAAVNFAVMFTVCVPFNKLKAVICSIMLAGFACCSVFLGGFFETRLSMETLPETALAVAVAVLLYLGIRFLLMRAYEKLNKVPGGTDKK